MSKIDDFLFELEDELRFLKKKDANEILKYYRNRINIATDYGEKEEHIIATMPTPKKIADEIYKSKGVNYLEKRTKQIRIKQIFNAIFSTILLIMIALALISILAIMVVASIKLINLMILSFKMIALLDTISLVLFIICYICIILIAMIYVFDLFYIIGTHFLANILNTLKKDKKEYKFMNFTLSGSIGHITKKKRFLVFMLVGFVGGLIVSGVFNFTNKGYIYRSINDEVQINKTLNVSGGTNKIKILESSALIKFVQDDNLGNIVISYGTEFNANLNYHYEGTTLIIEPIKTTTYDFLGLLDEPLPSMQIAIPLNYNLEDIEVALNDGILDIANITKRFNVKITGTSSTIALTKNNINTLEIEGYRLDFNNQENNINYAKITMDSGNYWADQDICNELEIDNHTGRFIFQNSTSQKITMNANASQNAFDKANIGRISFASQNAESYFRDVVFEKEVSLSSRGASKITIERVVVLEDISLSVASGTIKTEYMKAKQINLDLKQGVITLDSIGKDITTSGENTYFNNYNAYNIESKLSITSNKGDIALTNIIINQLSGTLNEGRLEISYSNILTTSLEENNVTISINDLDGSNFDLNVNKGNIYFYNDHIDSNIIVKITGNKLSANLSIDKKINQVEDEE